MKIIILIISIFLFLIPFTDQLKIGLTPIEEFYKGNNKAATWGQAFEVAPEVIKGWFR